MSPSLAAPNAVSRPQAGRLRGRDRPSFVIVSSWFRSYGFGDVFEGLVVGAYPLDEADVSMLASLGIERVLNLAEESEYQQGAHDAVQAALEAAGIEEHRLPLPDYGGLPPGLIERAVQEILDWLDENKRIYLHCRAGWQRSAALAAGVVAIHEHMDIDDALALVQSRKPSADPLPHQREDLRRWWDERSSAASERGATDPG
jgi:atypical dual specificity phosphatase